MLPTCSYSVNNCCFSEIFRAKPCRLFRQFSTIMSTADWSKLPMELVGLIASRLHFAEDCLRFGAVCKSWRIGILQNGNSLCSFLPWLMLPQWKNESLRTCYSPSNCKSYDICLPDVLDKRCWGSSHGWLVTLGANFEMHLLNPLSRAQISLPPLHKCPNLNLVCTGKSFRDSFVYKVILSASPCSADCVIFAIYSDNWKMAFAKPGDVSWTPLSCIRGHVDDAICHDGRFYAIDTFGEVLIWDFSGSFLKKIAFTPSRDMDNLVYVTTYLAEIEGQIHAIMRLLFDTRITDAPCLSTWCFKIYKLDICNEMWEEVKSLGDWSIFVGSNHSFSISCSVYPECESNCIYFTDDFSGAYYDAMHGYDMGIYNVQNGRVKPLLQENKSDFAFSLPLWIIPSLS
ncbi:putative F-box protein At3g25750 isoform X1 [Lycium barbarum]|uniref:putative F-box protein At3g25750 isoform X1 n=2 Tax=Lycium barbarum TaxID=112863 RepID=UPI00293E6D6B|nr:putative F-box protein At3g25750 isoform X1 [Lycium barbarum]